MLGEKKTSITTAFLGHCPIMGISNSKNSQLQGRLESSLVGLINQQEG